MKRQELHKTQLDNVNNASIYHMAFSIAATFRKARIHSTELPAPPNHWKDMLSHPHKAGFLAAAEREFRDLESAQTFKPTPISQIGTARPIPVRWVFTYKFDEDDYLNKYKARLVVRGDMQRDSLFEETYAGTLAASVFRFLMAIACYFDLEIKQFDAKNAFSQAFLDELIYIHYPEGFGRHGHVLRLIKALYGLRRSPLLWFNEISKALTKLGFRCIGDARCLFIKKDLIVFFYVDDICVLYHRDNAEIYEQFKDQLMSTFVLRELGDVKWFLALRVVRDRNQGKLWLVQDSYIDKLVERFNINGPPAKTPLSAQELHTFEGTATPEQILGYQQRIGSCLYAAIQTRPDISFTVAKLSQFLTNPGPDHHSAAYRLLSYLSGTRTLGIEYGDTDEETPYEAILTSHSPSVVPEGVEPKDIRPKDITTQDVKRYFQPSSDASFADNPDRKSSHGFLFKLFKGPIAWMSKKQTHVSTSTTQAELIAVSEAAKELIWWTRLFKSVELDLHENPTIGCDNLQTVRLLNSSAPKLITKLKHVDILGHWLREQVDLGSIQVEWVPTGQMPADGFTKALPKQKHDIFVRQLNLVDIGDRIRRLG